MHLFNFELQMSRATVFMLGDLDGAWAGERAMPDPWGHPREAFEQAFDRIDGCIDRIASLLEAPR